jgi:PAS domain S-box-containing protein
MSKLNAIIDRRNVARSAYTVWLVVLLGLAAGAFTLCVVGVALSETRERRTQLARTERAIDELDTQVGQAFNDAQVEIQQLLTGRETAASTGDWLRAINLALNRFGDVTDSPDVARAMTETSAFFAELASLRNRCIDWNTEYLATQSRLAERAKMAEASLGDMRAALSSAEGRQRLNLAAAIRQFHRLSGPAAQEVAGRIIAALDSANDVTEIPVEVSNLALLCERLTGEEQIDHLSDLKDNLFSPSLFRLGRFAARTGDPHAALHRDLSASLDALKEAVFGVGYRMDSDHQTLIPGMDGLYTLCRQRIESRSHREALRVEATHNADRYKAADDRLGAVTDVIREAITARIERNLVDGWRRLLAITIACGVLLTALGMMITRLIRRQIIAVEATRAALRDSEERARMIVENALDAVITMDSDGVITRFNAQAEAVFGWPTIEAVGLGITQLITRTSQGSVLSADLEECLKKWEGPMLNQWIEVKAIRRNGDEFPAELSITPIHCDGKMIFSAFLRDLTQQKEAEAERERLWLELQDASHRAGMAEVATGVLHNVGNVLNSVNVSATLVADRLRQSKVSGLGKAARMIEEHREDLPRFISEDQRGRQLPEYLVNVAQLLADEQSSLMDEMKSMEQGIEHIRQIVQAQQSWAKNSTMRERIRPAELLSEALKVTMAAYERHGIEVVEQVEEIGEFGLDRHKILQVLVNLLSNAKHALKRVERADKRITLRLGMCDGPEGRRVLFSVRDNGTGIRAEHMDKLFMHGFTTRKEGHGFGLHSSINAAREMGGTLRVFSEGEGKGAEFVLEIPVEQSEVRV